MKAVRLRRAFFLASIAFTAGCAFAPEVPASGRVAGYTVRSLVDDALARDYIEGRPLPSDLEGMRQEYLASGEVPSRTALASVAQEYSPDVSTLLFLESVSALPQVRELREQYERELAIVRRLGAERAAPEPPDDLLVLMVPGWFYRTNGSETNADFRIQRQLYELWGIDHALVPIEENGTVEENARIVAEAVREASRRHRVYLVSASKSGAEVALALGRELAPHETSRVVGWLSIVGAVRGSPLADRVLKPDLCWFVDGKLALDGFDIEGLKSMQTSRSRRAFSTLRFPPHVRIVTLMTVPLSGQISERGSFGYARMRELGPNDGLTLLADELVPGSVPLLLPGMDHFLGPGDQRPWSTAVFRVLMAELRH
jgi:hypothetical protein